MGMYDYVHFKMECPHCKAKINYFQTKNSNCTLDTLEPGEVSNFYAECNSCHSWIEFNRKNPKSKKMRKKPFTLKEVEKMGFKMVVLKADTTEKHD